MIAQVPPKKAMKRTASVPPAENSAKHAKNNKHRYEFVPAPNLPRRQIAGSILSFGQGDVGQLGLGEDVHEKTRPAVIPEHEDIVDIAAGGMHNACLNKDGKVLSFGCNDEGALGRDTSKEGSETFPGFVTLPEKAVQVTAGDSHSAALLEDGRVFAWGAFRDSHGNMGLTPRGNERLPVEILPGVKVIKIASGADHLVLLTGKGQVYTCGCAEQGQLGRVAARSADRHSRYGITHLLTPGLITLKATKKLLFQDIWTGLYCTFVKEYHHGEIYVFGLNNYYQIGLTEAIVHPYPQVSKTFSGRAWKHISSGQHHTIALDEMGQVFTMGRKEYGRLGLGPNCTDAKELVPVPALKSIKCIDACTGSTQSFAVTSAGELYAWGMGSSGQLGTGKEEDVETPVVIKGRQLESRTVIRVAGGGQHTVILAIPRPIEDEITN
ncbi:regulator of chromosome condensation isoform X1 [Neodiprion pinetum]|uniref:regulator of chromosome condensation isoform X1 n=1 Tax=Neodiprion pinetum TaxID=441929 RepID=UPI00371C05F3